MRGIIKKAGILLLTLWIISILVFLAFQIIPGDPTASLLGTEATPERMEMLRRELGLDRPLPERYFNWLSGLSTGNFGVSYSYKIPVAKILSEKLPVTMALSVLANLMVILISFPAGISLARNEGKPKERFFGVINQIVMSIPPFFIGIIFSAVFGLSFKLFTPGKYIPYAESPIGFWLYLFFPALSAALPTCAMTIKLLRSSILKELDQDYVRTAYSRGNTKKRVLRAHVLRNAVIPVITFLALSFAGIITGGIIIEQVFVIPGVGRLLVASIGNRDYPIVQAIIMIIALLVVSMNFLADVICQMIDPRLRRD